MAAFSPAQYQAVVDKLSSGINTVSQQKLPELTSVTNDMLGKWYIPGFVKDAVKWLVEQIIHITETVLNKIVELLKGAAAPVYLFEYSWKWGDIKGAATSVAAELTPETVTPEGWKGDAAKAYSDAVDPQSKAAAQIGTVSTATITSLTVCAAAGLAFYIALGIVIFQFITSLVAAIAAIGSLVFSWAGVGIVLGEVTVSSGAIIAAVTALVALLGAQASQMGVLHGQAEDSSAFPGGRWPVATKF